MFYFDTIHSVDMNAWRPETLSKIFFVVTIDYNTNIYHSFVCCIIGNPSKKKEFINLFILAVKCY